MVAAPDTARSRRLVVLTDLAAQEAETDASGVFWRDQGLVFTSAVGGPIEPGNLLPRSFRPLPDRPGCLTSASTTSGTRWRP